MRRHEARWKQLDVAIAVVTFEADDIVRGYMRDSRLPWPVLIDRERMLYRAYGMGRAPRRAIWSPSSFLAYARLLVRGRRPRRATGDTRQRGGDVLIDPEQRVRLHHVGSGPADRPSPEALFAAID